MSWRVVLAVLVALAAGQWTAAAQVLLFPQGRPALGELGPGLGEAQAALASGGEAVWFNPAGLAHSGRARLTAGGAPLRWQTAALDGAETTGAEAAPGHFALARPLSSGRGFPRFVYGLSLALTTDHRIATRLDGSRRTTAAGLPQSLRGGLGLDAKLPEGLRVDETGDGLGQLRVLSPGVGLAVGLAAWLRIGAAVQLERVTLREHSVTTAVYAGSDADTELSAITQTSRVLEGEALRLAYSLGVQLDLTPGVVLGLSVTLPTDLLDGTGRLRFNRSGRLDLTENGNPSSRESTVFIAGDGLPFELRRPLVARLGLAFISDWFLIEFDVIRRAAEGPYTALPGLDSRPPSTTAERLPALRTSAAATLGFATAAALAHDDRTSWLFGLDVAPAAVPPDDPLFRAVDLITTSVGLNHTRGDLSGTVALRWRQAEQDGVLFAEPGDPQPVPRSVEYSAWSVQLSGSLAL